MAPLPLDGITEMSRDVMPRAAAARRLMMMMNGPGGAPMSYESACETLDLFKGVWSNPLTEQDGMMLRKDVSVPTGLTWYDLRAPALNLFPTVTPLRNSVPRRQPRFPGDAAHWKAVTSIANQATSYAALGWVPEGQRADSISYTVAQMTQPYATFGAEDGLTEEARYAAEGFEDEDALVQMRLLLRTYVKEENAILGGNHNLSLSAPSTPTATLGASTGGSIGAGTYNVYCVALTYEGFQLATVSSTGVLQSKTVTGNDGQTFTINGGSSNKSSAGSTGVLSGSTNTIGASVPVVNGAVAYAWYVGTAGNELLQAITTINSVMLTSLIGSTQNASAITANCSTNSIAYDGLLTQAYNYAALQSGSIGSTYIAVQPTGTAGTGTPLTASGRGSVAEIDTMFQTMWSNYRISPTVLYVNAQELKNITNKVLVASGASLLRVNETTGPYKVSASGVITSYFNPFTADGGMEIPVKLHPTLPPGTILGWSEKLPPWYVSNQTPEVAEVLTRQDYYSEIWPKTSRIQRYGVYCQAALALYAPFGVGLITNIANG